MLHMRVAGTNAFQSKLNSYALNENNKPLKCAWNFVYIVFYNSNLHRSSACLSYVVFLCAWFEFFYFCIVLSDFIIY